MVNVLQGRCIIDFELDNSDDPNEFVIINSFDQFNSHTTELAKLVSSYHNKLTIKDKELKRVLVINFQQTLLGLGILGIGQPITDDYDEDMQ